MSKRYQKSEELLTRALQSIPLGAQTFSKSKTQYPIGVSPFFIKRAKGCRAWDVDGNEYIDFVSSLAAVTIGYSDTEVDAAVERQLKEGVIFSLSHPLEVEVAEKIKKLVPGAERVRFGKNGSDATSGAVRVARAYTGRDKILVCGYHGWQDWYIGSTLKNKGVPQATRDLTITVPYNSISALKEILQKHGSEVAALIMEPMNVIEPSPGYLQAVKQLVHEAGALLIFDETITGFRFANGGAQEYFGITADIATFGKGLANGYPLSAITGRADVMQLMEEVFFSFTFGGETLSLAAALATMTKLESEPVTKTLFSQGTKLMSAVTALISKHQLESCMFVSGHPSWHFINFKDCEQYSLWDLKTLFLQEVFERGILTLGSHNMSYAHTLRDIEEAVRVYDEVFSIISDSIRFKDLHDRLRCKVIAPLFKVRQ